jgi:hypothetical protein
VIDISCIIVELRLEKTQPRRLRALRPTHHLFQPRTHQLAH